MGVEKILFNHKVHKEGSKGTKLKPYKIDLRDLCERTTRNLAPSLK